jgi:DNA repair exonuclease SbcCD ATPase subunit
MQSNKGVIRQMNLVIKKLAFSNFKGQTDVDIDFSDVTDISGDNGIGKTRILDAFTWLLFNADSQGNAPGSDVFHEKPLDTDGNEIHNLDTTVTAYMLLDDQPFNLKRTQRENWVKKRGTTESTFQGNVSIYWINDVETKSTDFRDRVSGIATDKVFRLITSLGAFNAMNWKERRSTLVSMSGADVDALLLAREQYVPIRNELAQRNVGIDDLRRVLSDRRKAINQELQLLPARIDEAHKLRPQISDRERSDAERVKKDVREELVQIDLAVATINAGGTDADVRQQLVTAESECITAKRRLDDEYQASYRRLMLAKSDADTALRRSTQNLDVARGAVSRTMDSLCQTSEKLKACKDEYKKAYEVKFELPNDITRNCPACGQELPADAYVATVEKARADFTTKRKTSLNAIAAKGDRAKRDAESAAQTLDADQKHLVECEEADKTTKANAAAASNGFTNLMHPDYDSDPIILALKAKIEELKAGITDTPDDRIASYTARRQELNGILSRAQETIAKANTVGEFDKRIADLEALQRESGNKVADIEVMIGLAEHFIADRCAALEESINDMFPTIRWKLFNIQINGGLEDCCNCMIPCNGALVAYGGANTASNVNADIEITRVLSQHFGVVAPLFVDNAERINYIASPAGQLITLSVSSNAVLRVEHKTTAAVA